MPSIEREQVARFAEDGYIVLPQIVSHTLIQRARDEIASRVTQNPPSVGHRGPHPYFLVHDLPEPLLAPLYKSGAMELAESLLTPGARFEAPDHVQIALNIPPWDHRPGGPHIDGLTPPEPDGRPGTFSLLAGIFLTDQLRENAGNLWVWPGSHRGVAAYLRNQGAEALKSSIPYPPIDLSTPRQVTGLAGDVLFAHYMLGHNMGGNISDRVREVLYFRLRRAGHRQCWKQAVQDPFLEFEPVRSVYTADR